ncbi:Ig-specific serine endopeptidase MIP [Mycoplasma miroungirhinis]|uniref:DUF31 domain-containing protein n=1 Tax=Mycoplasma miroungirhinis TaxID=754516 RepID=A0A6M4JDQ6_9MOLU|nr:DUF31 family protein [Mycoplasma miroungirhinis]QJR44179.1 hypothetical protein HLA92_01900 [Mycoplasma miroungirhinis]
MKKTKLKYFLPILITLTTVSPLIAISCANNVNDKKDNNKIDKAKKDDKLAKDQKDNNVKQNQPIALVPEELKKIVAKSFDELYELKFKRGNKKDFSPETIWSQQDELLDIKVKSAFESQISIHLLDVILEPNANATGNLSLSIEITDKQTNNKTIKKYPLTGFKTNAYGISDDGTIKYNPNITNDKLAQYHNLSQAQRFKEDNDKYITGLKRQYQNKSVDQVRPDLKYKKENANQFNEIAKNIGVDNFENSAYKGFTLPVYKSDGTIDGLSLAPTAAPELFSDIDFIGGRVPFQSVGLARMLPNQKYKDIALQTFIGDFTYQDKFEKEILAYKKAIDEVSKWTPSDGKLAKFKKDSIDIVENDKQIAENDFQSKLSKTQNEKDKQSLKAEHQRQIAKFNEEINKINSYTNEFIINEYKNKIKEYELQANSGNRFRSGSGTLWLIDYEIPQGQNYPTKWFFATNSHVAKLMSNPTFSGFSLTRLDPNVGINTKLRITGFDNHYKTYTFNDQNTRQIHKYVTKVYDALDYLNTSPSDFLANNLKEKYKDVEEMADFAVIEVDFEGLLKQGNGINNSAYRLSQFGEDVQTDKYTKEDKNKFNDAQKLAKEITNDYYSLPENKKSSFLSTSYLKDYDKIDYPIITFNDKPNKKTDELFALGYPVSTNDFFLRRYEDYQEYNKKQSYHSLWVNSDYRFYYADTQGEDGPSNIKQDRLDKGNYLSYQIGLRTFSNKPGINDAFLVAPIRGNELYETYNEKGEYKQYFNTGLQYMLRHFVPTGGSSGSSVRNQDNKIIGLHSTIIDAAKTDFVVALRSEGFDYQGAFGKYNLPQYDLIYGGGKTQKTSYREALEKLHNQQKLGHTWLFKTGFSINDIPEEFKFKKSTE